MASTKPDYGIDAPGVIRNLIMIGLALAVAGSFLPPKVVIGGVKFGARVMFIITGSVLFAEGLLMLLYALHGKFKHRDRMLAMIHWRGDEQVLDVGTGRGLLAVGAARRLSSGKAIGIDIWNVSDLSGNSLQRTQQNLQAEGVENKVELRSEDARTMTFSNDFFDAVVSNLCIHNIPEKEGRAQACREIARVLKPGGTAVISDFKNVDVYTQELSAAGLTTEKRGPYLFDTFPPLKIVVAKKPKL
jgi:arsenite methyltransferase